MKLIKELHDLLIEALQKLGIIGTIAYVGAIFLFLLISQVDFKTETTKVWFLSSIETALLIFSGIIYWLESREETTKIKEALGVLREVYNRMAEQISTADKHKTVSITMTVDKLPEKIAEVIKKTKKS